MKAAVFHGQRDIRLEEVPEPKLGPGSVKVENEWCGICGSDLHEYLVGPINVPKPGHPHPLTEETLPIVMGHEFAGRVVEIGEGVSRVEVGDRVTVEPTVYCGQCSACLEGRHNLCVKAGWRGTHGGGGGFAKAIVVPEEVIFALPENVSMEEGALVEPFAVGLHAVRQARFLAGQTAMVFGAGPIGLCLIQCLRASGASLVLVAEVASARKEIALRVGADAVLDPKQEDVVSKVQEMTGGIGVDVSFEAAGVQASFQTALRATKRGGTLLNLAIWEHPIEIHPNDLVFNEIHLIGSIAYATEFPATIALMKDGRLDPSALITKKIPLDAVVSEGFEELVANKDEQVKILVNSSS